VKNDYFKYIAEILKDDPNYLINSFEL
ncbi:uncharacterized protein METZ01_LOCUS318239, partial [marine metagenome]